MKKQRKDTPTVKRKVLPWRYSYASSTPIAEGKRIIANAFDMLDVRDYSVSITTLDACQNESVTDDERFIYTHDGMGDSRLSYHGKRPDDMTPKGWLMARLNAWQQATPSAQVAFLIHYNLTLKLTRKS